MTQDHIMVTRAYAKDAASRGINYPPDWILADDPQHTCDDCGKPIRNCAPTAGNPDPAFCDC